MDCRGSRVNQHPAPGRAIPGRKDEVMAKKAKTIWCYLDGKKHCDVVMYALAANVDVQEAKKILTANYPLHVVTFKVQ